jgi:hypothetical protein
VATVAIFHVGRWSVPLDGVPWVPGRGAVLPVVDDRCRADEFAAGRRTEASERVLDLYRGLEPGVQRSSVCAGGEGDTSEDGRLDAVERQADLRAGSKPGRWWRADIRHYTGGLSQDTERCDHSELR